MLQDTIKFQETVTLNRTGKPFEALEINGIPKALQRAQRYAKKAYANKGGFVFAAPDLVKQRIEHPTKEHPFWRWYTLLTEEIRIEGYHLIVHGGYVLNTPKRIEQALTHPKGLVNGAGRLTDEEVSRLVLAVKQGHIDNKITLFPFAKFKELKQEDIADLQRVAYGIILNEPESQALSSGSRPLDTLVENPRFMSRAGGREQSESYVSTLRKLGANHYGNWYISDRATSNLLVVGADFDLGFLGYYHLGYGARFFGVSSDAGGVAKNFTIVVNPKLTEQLEVMRSTINKLEALCGLRK